MKLRNLTLLLIIGLLQSLFSQSINFQGKVTDSKTNQPISGAFVFINYSYSTYTNNYGLFLIQDIPQGKYEIKISHLGYKLYSGEVTIESSLKDFNITLEPSLIELDEVIVSTSKTEDYIKNSPYSELLISAKEIESKPLQSFADIVKNQPGVSLLRDGVWGTEISIRGLNRENIVTLIDGSRILTATDIAARLSMVNLNDIERIEIIKGASSSIYGSGATGGIVNIITKSPSLYNTFSINGNVSAQYNSVNNLSSFNGLLYSGGSFWASKFAGSYRKADNIQTPLGELKNSQFEDYSFTGSLNVLPVTNQKLSVDYQLFKANDVGIPGASVFPNNADVRYPFEKRELISAGYEIQNISKMFYKFSAKYSYQFIARDVENIPHTVQMVPGSGSTPTRRVSVLKITPGADHKSNNILLQGNLLLADWNNLIIGMDYWDRKYEGHREKYQKIEVLDSTGQVVNTTNKVIGEKPLPNSSYSSLGVFAQDGMNLLKDKLDLNLGVRYDYINITGEKTFNPEYEIVNGNLNNNPTGQQIIWNDVKSNNSSFSSNLGLKYSLSPMINITIGFAYSFRSPSLEERFQFIDQGSLVRIGNPNLKPEEGKSADFGFRLYADNLKIITSIYYNYFNNLVSEVRGTFEGRNATFKTNIGEARIYGFDLSSEYNFINDYVFYSAFAYTKGDDVTSGGNLPEIPPLNGTVGIKFNLFDFANADVSSTLFAEQGDVASGELKTPGYAIFNFVLSSMPIDFTSVKIKVFAGVENLFDKSYRNHLSTTRGNLTIEPGRNIFTKLTMEF
ncbi:MAG: TonB-dependent receptor [Ignavibacterium sp.]|jgi:hemoglobin/transferrin/lactoferrin receptor protein|nr:TonB-dependent receptor [Ignavibacterium sp.]MDX9713123.1 TonB-dependent receptor [Ignavibacteriaceae bacterium]